MTVYWNQNFLDTSAAASKRSRVILFSATELAFTTTTRILSIRLPNARLRDVVAQDKAGERILSECVRRQSLKDGRKISAIDNLLTVCESLPNRRSFSLARDTFEQAAGKFSRVELGSGRSRNRGCNR